MEEEKKRWRRVGGRAMGGGENPPVIKQIWTEGRAVRWAASGTVSLWAEDIVSLSPASIKPGSPPLPPPHDPHPTPSQIMLSQAKDTCKVTGFQQKRRTRMHVSRQPGEGWREGEHYNCSAREKRGGGDLPHHRTPPKLKALSICLGCPWKLCIQI